MTPGDQMLSRHFSLFELRCPCCHACTMDHPFLFVLDQLRDLCGFPLEIESGFRCPAHNAAVNGKSGSAHPDGKAADLRYATGFAMRKIVAAAIQVRMTGIGINRGAIHVDFVCGALPRMWHYYPPKKAA